MLFPFFTIRDALMSFKLSTSDVLNEIKDWRLSVSLNFLAFLEAIARTADVILIPTDANLQLLGSDDITDFYQKLEATNLWSVIENPSQAKSESCLSKLLANTSHPRRKKERIAQVQGLAP